MSAPAALFDGSFLVDSAIRRYRRKGATPAEATVLEAAFADQDYAPFVTQQAAALTAKNAGIAGSGILSFLQLLMQYLPQIIALIMEFFNPTPTPAPA